MTTNTPAHSGLLAWFACNPVAANLLMLIILVGGYAALQQMDKEVFPRFSPHQMRVVITYPGAGPQEIEASVAIRVEEAIYDVPGVKHLHSEIWRSGGEIRVEVLPEYSKELVMNAVRSRIQDLQRLPKGLEKIDVQPDTRKEDDGVIWVALHGATDAVSLKRFGDRIQQDLVSIAGVSRAVNYADTPYEVAIEISNTTLQQYQISLQQVADAIRQASLDLPGGLIKNPDGELLLRVNGLAKDIQALGSLPIKTSAAGTRITLAQIAQLKDGLEETLLSWRHNGETAQGWEVHAERDSVSVARRVKAYVASMHASLPPGVTLLTWWDDSQAYDERIKTLLEDALSGFFLVCLVLTLFLQLRVALWAGVGIFTSVCGALWFMPMLDVSLNMLSLFGFLLAMGILVDDAIIIGENIHSQQAQNPTTTLAASVQGVQEVALPVTLSVLIVLVAFLPGLFLPGWGGQLLRPICVIMILTLVFSLVEALLILPAHLVGGPQASSQQQTQLQCVRRYLNQGLHSFTLNYYQPLLQQALAWRYLTLSMFVLILMFCAALVASDRVRQSINPDVTKDSFWAYLTLPQTAAYDEAKALSAQVEQALFSLRDTWDAKLQAEVGSGQQSIIVGVETMVWEHAAGFWLELSPFGRQHVDVEAFVQAWRQRIGELGAAKIDFNYKEGDSPYDVELDVNTQDPAQLMPAVEAIKQALNMQTGVYDVIDSSEPGKPEVLFKPTPQAEQLGLKLADLAQQVRQGYYGEEVQRFQRGRSEIKVMLRYPLAERQALDSLRKQSIKLPNNSYAPLGSMADIHLAPGFAKLVREDRRRVIKVQARVDSHRADLNSVYRQLEQQLLPVLQQRFNGLQVNIGQERQEQQVLLQALGRNTLIALLVIYALIAVPFRSYSKPLIFLLAAPVAWCGAILAHWLAGLPLSLESLVGMIAASGVVVNDSLVLLDYLRQHSDDPAPVEELISAACVARFRPILLAFLTNFAGFLPTLLETSPQAQFLIPMTLSLSAGLLFGMAASLILTPVCYAVLSK